MQAYSMVIFSLFALAFFSFFAIKPTLTSFFQLRRQIADARQIDQDLSIKIKSLLRAQSEYYRIQDQIALLDEALPAEPAFPALLQKIEKMSQDRNEEITGFSTKDITLLASQPTTPDEQKQNWLEFTLETNASYTDHESLLKGLHDLRRLVLVKRLNLSEHAESENPVASVKMEITANAYYNKL